MAEVLIVPTGTANIASVKAAFRRLGATPVVVEDADRLRKAERVMLPGVGAFGSSLKRLLEHGLAEALRERIAQDRPTMAICVGHQLLFTDSEESPGTAGLGIVASGIGRFPAGVRVPQFGWNRVRPE